MECGEYQRMCVFCRTVLGLALQTSCQQTTVRYRNVMSIGTSTVEEKTVVTVVSQAKHRSSQHFCDQKKLQCEVDMYRLF